MNDGPNIRPRSGTRNPDWQGAQGIDSLIDCCIVTAEQLLSIVNEETEALKDFKADRLLDVFPRKEVLAKQLNSQVKELCALAGKSAVHNPGSQRDTISSFTQFQKHPHNPADNHAGKEQVKEKNLPKGKQSTLKQMLAEIESHNQRNHIFIEGSLAYWQDLLNLFIPGTYVPGHQGPVRRRNPSTKGLAFNKEI